MKDEEVKTFIKTELETLEYFTLQLLKLVYNLSRLNKGNYN